MPEMYTVACVNTASRLDLGRTWEAAAESLSYRSRHTTFTITVVLRGCLCVCVVVVQGRVGYLKHWEIVVVTVYVRFT